MTNEMRLQELLSQWEAARGRGESVTPEELCRDDANLLAELRRQIRDLDRLNAALATPEESGPLQSTMPETSPAPAGSCPAPSELDASGPRYGSLQFHQKGGFGEVYQATDRELDRAVALKRIKPEHAHNPHLRQRFLREARITGKLEHPGIVPVYGLVHDADGQPYYAMRFVEGKTLAKAVEEFHAPEKPGRDPSERSLCLRQLLGVFVAVCKTLAYAHSRGIVHRDLKPANIILGPYGETLVLDWGLAKQEEEESPESGQEEVEVGEGEPWALEGSLETPVGGAMGTPAFMSPEQAAGEWDVVGPASDIYSLGATLYALLTSQVPFARGPWTQMQLRIQRGDFPPPRQVKKDMPRALEAVCLKAMARQPEERYASALDLAGDIEHWLADEPVTAYREPIAARMGRWGRRHRGLTAGVAGLLVTSVVALGIGLFAVNRERRQTQKALDAETQARADETFARGQAEQQRDRADGNLRLARKAVDETTTKITRNPLLKEANFHQLRHDLLEYMVPFYEEFVKQQASEPELEAERGRAFHSLGLLRYAIGKKEAALSDYEQMRMIFAQLAADFPSVAEYRQDLAGSHNDLAVLLRELGKREEAAGAHRDALKIQAQLAKDSPAVPEYRRDLAASRSNLALLLRELGKRTEAQTACVDAVNIQTQLAQDFPMVPEYREKLAIYQNNLSVVLGELGKGSEGESARLAALKIREQLVQDFPDVSQYRKSLADSYSNLSLGGDLGKREAACRAALRIRAQLAKDFPALPQYREDLAKSYNNLGIILRGQDKRDEAENAYRDAVKIRAQLARDFPAQLAYRQKLATGHANLGRLLAKVGKQAEAETAFLEALTIQTQLAKEFPTVPEYRDNLANSHNSLGILLGELGKRTDAENAYCEARKIYTQLATDFPNAPEYRNDLAGTMVNMAILLRQNKEFAEARRLLEEAVPHHQAALRANPSGYRDFFRNNRGKLAETLVDLGEHAAAADAADEFIQAAVDPANDLYTAASIFSRCVPLAERDGRLSEDQRKEQAQAYADRAIDALRRSIQNRFRDVAYMKKDTDLDPLRSHPGFQKLLRELEAAVKPQAK
jgi:serine/threonine-protein kinase